MRAVLLAVDIPWVCADSVPVSKEKTSPNSSATASQQPLTDAMERIQLQRSAEVYLTFDAPAICLVMFQESFQRPLCLKVPELTRLFLGESLGCCFRISIFLVIGIETRPILTVDSHPLSYTVHLTWWKEKPIYFTVLHCALPCPPLRFENKSRWLCPYGDTLSRWFFTVGLKWLFTVGLWIAPIMP